MSTQSCASPPPAFGRLHAESPLPLHSTEKAVLLTEPAVPEPAQAHDQGFLARIWLAYRRRRNEARLRNLATDMDPHMLEDVGAPNWLINETTLQRDLARLRNADYMRW